MREFGIFHFYGRALQSAKSMMSQSVVPNKPELPIAVVVVRASETKVQSNWKTSSYYSGHGGESEDKVSKYFWFSNTWYGLRHYQRISKCPYRVYCRAAGAISDLMTT